MYDKLVATGKLYQDDGSLIKEFGDPPKNYKDNVVIIQQPSKKEKQAK